MSLEAFKTECRATDDPHHYGITTGTRPTGQGCDEACVMVRMPDEARLEIVVENSVTSSEVNLRGVENLDDQQAEEFAQKLKRQMMRKLSGKKNKNRRLHWKSCGRKWHTSSKVHRRQGRLSTARSLRGSMQLSFTVCTRRTQFCGRVNPSKKTKGQRSGQMSGHGRQSQKTNSTATGMHS